VHHSSCLAAGAILVAGLLSACGGSSAPAAVASTGEAAAPMPQTTVPTPAVPPAASPPPPPTGAPPPDPTVVDPPIPDVPAPDVSPGEPPFDPPPLAPAPEPLPPDPVSPGPTPAIVPSGRLATVSWAPVTARTDGTTPSRVAAYRVFYGLEVANPEQWVDLGDPAITSAQFSGMSPGRWYFVVVAIDDGGLESEPSDPQAYDFT
jgi:hypothetical protein